MLENLQPIISNVLTLTAVPSAVTDHTSKLGTCSSFKALFHWRWLVLWINFISQKVSLWAFPMASCAYQKEDLKPLWPIFVDAH